ncbi:pheST operon leader peptide PheM [Enterobacter hormaechei]|nr:MULTISPECIES: pheST operon leader peptide PheM [Enterobacter cloacae complex]HDQ5266190.1 pheST operon leader peptide PheM [Escherichia coli]EHF4963098.1 pheST operon leader peptide PheM [Enterobacter hormaechei]EHF4976991.1 pheST operon leader peptide PheM [Enterobacter hormaechei]EHF4982217.1 pheST operon leader peptide PheM [Enterobacter hormaechei]EHF4987102.1 pheST operon leader peptide PheM [Enterobacter hormaechei]
MNAAFFRFFFYFST